MPVLSKKNNLIDKDFIDRIYRMSHKFVQTHYKSFIDRNVYDDLVHEGVYGVIEVIRNGRVDLSRSGLNSYFYVIMRRYIQSYLYKVVLGSSCLPKDYSIHKYDSVKKIVENQNGYKAERSEVEEELLSMGYNINDIATYSYIQNSHSRISVNDNDCFNRYVEYDPLDKSSIIESKELLHELMKRLNNRERAVIRMKYFKELETPQIASTLGISIRQVLFAHNQALDKLRMKYKPVKKKMYKGKKSNRLKKNGKILLYKL